MKTSLVGFLCLFVLFTSMAGEGQPPQPANNSARFTVVSGMIDHGGGPVPTFIRLDTFTGQTWAYQQVPLPGNRGALINVWIPSHELGSEVYAAAVKALTAPKSLPPLPE